MEEKAGKDGVASLASTLLDYGTTTYDRLAYQRELDKIAADVSTGTGFGVDVTTSGFDRGVQLLADAELHPAMRDADFQIAKQQEYQEVAGEEHSPDHLTRISLINALYPENDPIRRHPTPESVKALTLDDVHDWYDTAYRPDLATIVVIGDVTPAQARAVVEKWFGGWQAHGPMPNLYPSAAPNNAAASFTVPATGRVQDTVILSQTLSLKREDPDVPALRVANAALSGGFYASILFHDLRETTGYVYSINSDFDLGRTRSAFSVVYGASPENVSKANALIANRFERYAIVAAFCESFASSESAAARAARHAGRELQRDRGPLPGRLRATACRSMRTRARRAPSLRLRRNRCKTRWRIGSVPMGSRKWSRDRRRSSNLSVKPAVGSDRKES